MISLPYWVARVEEVRNLTRDIKMYTLRINESLNSDPGQYVMVWAPGVGEIPISLSLVDGEIFRLVIARKGKVTSYIHENIKEGDKLYFRGPYGNGFKLQGGKALIVGGGYGVAPLLFLARELARRYARPDVVVGFRSKEHAILISEFEEYADRLVVSTDDGSLGVKGTAVDVASQLIDKNIYTTLYTCGKEQMMYKLVELAVNRGIKTQASLERLIKCGVGICGSCVLEPLGFRVCRDGPVFDGETLLKTVDFGRFWHDSTGKRIPIEEVK